MKLEGKKLQMSQVFLEDGKCIPVTLVSLNTTEGIGDDIVGKDAVVIGTSKGAGFTGVVKKYHFKGGPKTHGQSDRWRAPGASGSTTSPGRVLKGSRRSGRMGNYKVTLKGLKILGYDQEKKEVTIKGPLPGSRNSKVMIEVL